MAKEKNKIPLKGCLPGEVRFAGEDDLVLQVEGIPDGKCPVCFTSADGKASFSVEGRQENGYLLLPSFGGELLKYALPGMPFTIRMEGAGKAFTLANPKKLEENPYLQAECVRWGAVSKGTKAYFLPQPPAKDLDFDVVHSFAGEVAPFLAQEAQEGELCCYPYAYLGCDGMWRVTLATVSMEGVLSTVCMLKKVSLTFGKLTMHLEVSEGSLQFAGGVLRYRGKREEDRTAYPCQIVKESQMNQGNLPIRQLTLLLPLKTVKLRGVYWDAVAQFTDGEGREYPLFLSMAYRYRAYLSYLYRGTFFRNRNIFYPYNTGSHKLAFQYRRPNRYDTVRYHMKELAAILAYKLTAPFWKKQNIRLVFEKRCLMAQDNGFYFFKYCMDHDEEKRQGARIYYVMKKKAADLENLAPYQDHVIRYGSFRHLLAMQAARLLITTDTRYQVYPVRMRGSFLQRVLRGKDVVFLQHGVTALKMVDFYYGKGGSGGCSLFVTTCERESQIIKEHFGYGDREVACTGFARWDVLEDRSEGSKEILIMPTWRSWLENSSMEDFFKSDYFRNYMALLNSTRFRRMLDNYDLTACFYLHSKFKQFIGGFQALSKRIRMVPFGAEPANELLMHSRLLVTDYSSVCWEMLYLGKPTVFFQFDRPDYLQVHGSYLDMGKELPGECAFTASDLVGLVEEYAARDFSMKEEYGRLQEEYFPLQDDQNSKRICDAIMKRWP